MTIKNDSIQIQALKQMAASIHILLELQTPHTKITEFYQKILKAKQDEVAEDHKEEIAEAFLNAFDKYKAK